MRDKCGKQNIYYGTSKCGEGKVYTVDVYIS